jgi:T5SS/PEP-CTERM-associated repeat protein
MMIVNRRWVAAMFAAALAVAAPALADVTIQSGSASLKVQGTDFFDFPGQQSMITAPDPTNFTDTAEVSFNGHGSVHMDVATSQASHAEISGDALTITSTQSFAITHTANDADRQNLVSHADSALTITFCTTKKSSFLFTASGETAVPSDIGTSGSFRGHPFADGSVGASLLCKDLCPPQVVPQVFGVGVNVGSTTPLQPSGSTQGSGTIPPGCYVLSAITSAGLTSPLLCKNATGGVCQPFQIPPDINDSPPTAKGSVTVTLTVTPATSTNDDEITWVGADNGAFGDPMNWDPQQVPTITPDESDTAIFSSGGTINIDVAADAPAAAVASLEPRNTSTRNTGRIRAKGTKEVVVRDFNMLLLDDTSLDAASLVVGGKSKFHIAAGTVIAHNTRIGHGGAGTVIVDPQSFFTADLMLVGEDGDGLLNVRNGGTADAAEARLGNGTGLGSATIDGQNTTWTTGTLSIGFSGHGEMLVRNGGVVTSATAIVDGGVPPAPQPAFGSAGNGNCVDRSGGAGVDVTGSAGNTSSAWHVDTLSIGGLGCVEATALGGIVTGEHAGGDVRVGTTEAGDAQLFVNLGGVLVVGKDLVVGDTGHARLRLVDDDLNNTALVKVTGAMAIGGALPPAGQGVVEVEGEASALDLITSNSLRIPDGQFGTGSLTMSNGARVKTVTTAEIGTDGSADPNGHGGQGVVELDGISGHADLTRWSIGQSLTIGHGSGPGTGQLLIRDATVAVDQGTITIQNGGSVSGLGQENDLIINGGSITNNGIIVAPVFIGGPYSSASTGRIVQLNGGSPATTLPPPAAPHLGTAASPSDDVAAPRTPASKTPPPPNPPLVFGANADISNTTLVLQFVNGFAPHQGDALPVFQAQGQVTGQFAAVEVVGLMPGASFNLDTQTGMATSLTDTVALPTVSVKAPAKLKESAKKGAKIKFARTGDTTDPLTVHYQLGGTAEPGVDYGLLPGTLEIPAKKKSATLVIVPFADGLIEPPETIELTVLPGDDYAPSSPLPVTITLLSTEKKPKK